MKSRKRPVLPAFLFDLDGTLLDSVYDHVAAWSRALKSRAIALPLWKLHRRIGMSGTSFLHELLREASDARLQKSEMQKLEQLHDKETSNRVRTLEPLPGAQDLLAHLSSMNVRWAIATTGGRKQTMRLLERLKIPKGVPMVTGEE